MCKFTKPQPNHPTRRSLTQNVCFLTGGAAVERAAPSNVSLGFVLYQNDRFFRSKVFQRRRATIRVLSGTVQGPLVPQHLEMMFRPQVSSISHRSLMTVRFPLIFESFSNYVYQRCFMMPPPSRFVVRPKSRSLCDRIYNNNTYTDPQHQPLLHQTDKR